MLGPGSAAGLDYGFDYGFDYDELARRLLAQVVRRLAGAGLADPAAAPDLSTLRETVAGLEYELADAWAKHGKLAAENVRLREELRSRSNRWRWPGRACATARGRAGQVLLLSGCGARC